MNLKEVLYKRITIETEYYMAQNFGGRKLWRIAANKHFGGQNIGGLATLHSKIARIKAFGGQNFGRPVANRQIHQSFLLPKFCAIATVCKKESYNYTDPIQGYVT